MATFKKLGEMKFLTVLITFVRILATAAAIATVYKLNKKAIDSRITEQVLSWADDIGNKKTLIGKLPIKPMKAKDILSVVEWASYSTLPLMYWFSSAVLVNVFGDMKAKVTSRRPKPKPGQPIQQQQRPGMPQPMPGKPQQVRY